MSAMSVPGTPLTYKFTDREIDHPPWIQSIYLFLNLLNIFVNATDYCGPYDLLGKLSGYICSKR